MKRGCTVPYMLPLRNVKFALLIALLTLADSEGFYMFRKSLGAISGSRCPHLRNSLVGCSNACLPSFDFLTMVYPTSKIVQVLFSYHKCAEFAVFAYTFHVEYVHPASRANVPPQRFSSLTEIRKQPVHPQSPKSKTPAHMSQHPKLLEHPVREQPNIQRRRNSQVPR